MYGQRAGGLGSLYSFRDDGQTISDRFLSGYKKGAEIEKLSEESALRREESAFKSEMHKLAERDDVSSYDIADVMLRYPRFAASLKESYEIEKAEDKDRMVKQMSMVYGAIRGGKPEIAQEMIKSYAQAYEEAGNPKIAEELNDFRTILADDPDNAGTMAGMFLAGALGPDKFTANYVNLEQERRQKQLFPWLVAKEKAARARARTAADLNRARVESLHWERILKLRKFQAELNKSPSPIGIETDDMFPNGTSVFVLKNGDTVVKDPYDNIVTGEDRVRVLKAAHLSRIQYEGEMISEQEAVKQAKKLSGQYLTHAASLLKMIPGLKRAKELVEEGAYTGPGAKYWTIFSAANVELNTVVSSLTVHGLTDASLGPISEGEMMLVKDTQLPTGMGKEKTIQFIDNKIIAIEKLASATEQMGHRLSAPGATVWKIRNEDKSPEPTPKREPTVVELPDGSVKVSYAGTRQIFPSKKQYEAFLRRTASR